MASELTVPSALSVRGAVLVAPEPSVTETSAPFSAVPVTVNVRSLSELGAGVEITGVAVAVGGGRGHAQGLRNSCIGAAEGILEGALNHRNRGGSGRGLHPVQNQSIDLVIRVGCGRKRPLGHPPPAAQSRSP